MNAQDRAHRLRRAIVSELGSEEAADYRLRFLLKTGQIGGTGEPVEVRDVVWSEKMTDEQKKTYSTARRNAILVGYIPAGMQSERGEKISDEPPAWKSREIGVDESSIPPRDEWIVLPETFNDVPVYYTRIPDPFLFLDV